MRPHWRKMTWVLILWCGAIIAWAISAGASTSHSCDHPGVLTHAQCQNATDAGAGLGIAVILFIGFIGFVFFGLIWLMSRPRTRVCPACGEDVKKGRTACPKCSYDFAASARAVTVP